MMTLTEELLRLTPTDALVKMLNVENATRFPGDVFLVSPPTAVDTLTTTVTLTVREPHHKLDNVPYSGSLQLTYQRLDVSSHFAGVLSGFRPELPTSTQILLDEIARRTGQKFYPEDFVHEDILPSDAAPYVLKAKVESWRWVGTLPVVLIDLVPLATFFTDALPLGESTTIGALDSSPQLTDPLIVYPTLNGTDAVNTYGLPLPGVEVQDDLTGLYLVRTSVPAVGQRVDPLNSPWVCDPTPSPYNLWNARNFATAEPAVGLSNQDLDRALVFELDPAYCTNFAGTTLRIPYRGGSFEGPTYTVEPRLTRYSVKSIVNGTAYRDELNLLTVGYQFTYPATRSSYTFNALGDWTVGLVPDRRALQGAVVVYNGQRRSTDAPPVDLSCNRVLVLSLGSDNRAYRSNFAIHYRAPIVLINELPNARVSDWYEVFFNPTDGTAPYTLTHVSGEFAPGHTFDGVAGKVSGRASEGGTWRPVVDVTDATGKVVRYNYRYTTTVASLVIAGNAPDAKVGETYQYQYFIEGGYLPYQTLLSDGGLPDGLRLEETTATITGQLQLDQSRTWSVVVRDGRGQIAMLDDSMVVRP